MIKDTPLDKSFSDLMLCLSVMHCCLGRISDKLSVAMDKQNSRLEEEETRDEIKVEWQLCALVIDR